MAETISAPRGVNDILPGKTDAWLWLEALLRECAGSFACQEIRFPTFEHTELFLRGVGDTTDVVQKEMYTFDDKKGRSLTLRPEGTASVARAFIQHSLAGQGLPLKVYYIAPNFRYEKPQAGRLRQHHQFGVEVFGPAGAAADAELLSLAGLCMERAGLSDVSLRINSIGCPVCRPAYQKSLAAFFEARQADLCHTCHDRLARNPLRILDCKEPGCAALRQDAPPVLESLCPDCASHWEELRENLTALGIAFTVDPHIVRGLDYYTRTVFEFVGDLGAGPLTLCAGGRYDGLVKNLGGPDTPALGFGMGLERLLLALETQGILPQAPPVCELFIAAMGEEAAKRSLILTNRLRVLGVHADRDLMGRSLKAQMKTADRLGAPYVLVLGETELKENAGVLKNMRGGENIPCSLTAEDIAKSFYKL